MGLCECDDEFLGSIVGGLYFSAQVRSRQLHGLRFVNFNAILLLLLIN